jgi:hypothetical protein
MPIRAIRFYTGKKIAHSGDLMEKCGVVGCDKEATRSISKKAVEVALPDLELEGKGRRVHLCRDHYRVYKGKTKEKRKMERLDW